MENLRYCLYGAAVESDENRHPQKVMRELGITYQHSTPVSMGDQWWFWNCENIPDEIPKFLRILDLDPIELVGYGLSKEEADKIRDYQPD